MSYEECGQTSPHMLALRFAAILAAAAAGLALGACAGDPGTAAGWTVTRDTLASGAVRVVNVPPEGSAPGYVLEEELRIGTMDGEGPAQFGQLKGIAALTDGRIAVLDAMAQEVRLFDAAGEHLATYGRQGAGPGELEGPWGLMRDHRDRLWVPDHANDRMTVFDPDSGYVESWPMPVLRYGFIWSGAMLDDGRIVKPSMTLVPERRAMLRVYGPGMELVDSILAPEPTGPPVDREDPPGSFYWEGPGGMPRGYMGVPFYPRAQQVYAPSGHVWTSPDGQPDYRIARTNLQGDTSLIIETRRAPVPLPDSVREGTIAVIREAIRERGGSVDQDWSKVPHVEPPVRQLFVGDDGELWVRTASPDSLARFDIYRPDGAFDRAVVTTLSLSGSLAPVVRGDRLWGVVRDDFGVQYVVRGRVREATLADL